MRGGGLGALVPAALLPAPRARPFPRRRPPPLPPPRLLLPLLLLLLLLLAGGGGGGAAAAATGGRCARQGRSLGPGAYRFAPAVHDHHLALDATAGAGANNRPCSRKEDFRVDSAKSGAPPACTLGCSEVWQGYRMLGYSDDLDMAHSIRRLQEFSTVVKEQIYVADSETYAVLAPFAVSPELLAPDVSRATRIRLEVHKKHTGKAFVSLGDSVNETKKQLGKETLDIYNKACSNFGAFPFAVIKDLDFAYVCLSYEHCFEGESPSTDYAFSTGSGCSKREDFQGGGCQLKHGQVWKGYRMMGTWTFLQKTDADAKRKGQSYLFHMGSSPVQNLYSVFSRITVAPVRATVGAGAKSKEKICIHLRKQEPNIFNHECPGLGHPYLWYDSSSTRVGFHKSYEFVCLSYVLCKAPQNKLPSPRQKKAYTPVQEQLGEESLSGPCTRAEDFSASNNKRGSRKACTLPCNAVWQGYRMLGYSDEPGMGAAKQKLHRKKFYFNPVLYAIFARFAVAPQLTNTSIRLVLHKETSEFAFLDTAMPGPDKLARLDVYNRPCVRGTFPYAAIDGERFAYVCLSYEQCSEEESHASGALSDKAFKCSSMGDFVHNGGECQLGPHRFWKGYRLMGDPETTDRSFLLKQEAVKLQLKVKGGRTGSRIFQTRADPFEEYAVFSPISVAPVEPTDVMEADREGTTPVCIRLIKRSGETFQNCDGLGQPFLLYDQQVEIRGKTGMHKSFEMVCLSYVDCSKRKKKNKKEAKEASPANQLPNGH